MVTQQVILFILCMAVSVLAVDNPKANIDRSPTAWHNAFHEAVKPVLRWFLMLPLIVVFLTAILIGYLQMRIRALPRMAENLQKATDARNAMVAKIKEDDKVSLKERRKNENGGVEPKVRAWW